MGDTTTWHHGAVVRNGSTITLYVDGAQGGSGTPSLSTFASDNITIGGNNGAGENFAGTLDDVRIYSRALSAAEIAELAAGRHTTAIWDGSSSTNFETAFNWNTSAVPDPYTHIIAKRSGSGSPVLTATISGASLTIEADGSLDLHGYNFEFNDSGTLKGGGTLKLLGAESVQNLSNVATTSTGTVLYYGTGSYSGLAAGSSYNNLTINDGLVGYWKLDETSGIRAVDSSGHGSSGSLVGGPTISSTVAPMRFTNPRSVSFDASNDYVDLGSVTTLSAGRPFSICWWENIQSDTGDHPSRFNLKMGGTSNYFLLFRGQPDTSHNNITWGKSPGSPAGKSTAAPTIASKVGMWTHYCLSGTDPNGDPTGFALYVDGYTVAVIAGGGFDAVATNRIGHDGLLNGSDALLDDVRIYNRALSAQEIQSLAAGSHPSSASGTYTLGSNLAVAGALTINAGNLDVSSSNYAITLSGSLINNGGKFTARKGTITLDGTASAKILQSGGQRLNALTVGAAGAWTLQDRLTMSGSLTQTAGTLDAGSGSYAIHAQTLNQSAGTFIPRSGVVVLNGSTDQTLTAASTLNTLRIEDPTENGLVGYWKFDEMTGTTARDSSPSGNNGTLTNGPAWSGSSLNTGVQFVNSGALKFDGTNDYVSMGNSASLQISARTLAAWIKTTNAGSGFREIINKEFAYIMALNNNVLSVYDWSGVVTISSGVNVADGAWHHVTVVLQAGVSNGSRFYVDGSAVGSAFTYVSNTQTNGVVIGSNTGAADFIAGLIDDVRIYNRALSANEIANLYRGRYASGNSSTATVTLGGNVNIARLNLDSGNLATSTRTLTVNNAVSLLRGGGNLTLGSATTSIGGNLTISGSVLTGGAGTLDVNGDLSILTGSLIAPSGTMTVSSHFLMSGGMLNANGGTLTFDGSGEQTLRTLGTGDDQDFSTVTVSKSAGSLTLAGNAFSGSALNVTSGTFSPGALAATVGALTINGGTFTGAGGSLDVNGNATLSSGTFTAPSGYFTVFGDWTKSGGTFTPGSAAVTLDGGNQAINGSTTFYNLTKGTAAAATLTFQAGETQTITNKLSLTGALSNLLSLRSSQTGTSWNINPQGTRSVQYLDVKDSNNANATEIDCIGLNCTDNGNNVGWKFANPATGGTSATYREALRDRRQAGETVPEGTLTVDTLTGLPTNSEVAKRNAERLAARNAEARKAIEWFALNRRARKPARAKTPAAPAIYEKAPDGNVPQDEDRHEDDAPLRAIVRRAPSTQLTVVVREQTIVYRDVPTNAWFAPYVKVVAEAGIAVGPTDPTGKPRGVFKPEAPVTYAEIAKMALTVAGLDTYEVPQPPKNLSAQNSWASRFVAIAEQVGISTIQESVQIDTAITRGAFVQTILEAVGIPTGFRPGEFSDLPPNHPYAGALGTAAHFGMIDGDRDVNGNPTFTIRPDAPITRAEAAKVLTIVLRLLKK